MLAAQQENNLEQIECCTPWDDSSWVQWQTKSFPTSHQCFSNKLQLLVQYAASLPACASLPSSVSTFLHDAEAAGFVVPEGLRAATRLMVSATVEKDTYVWYMYTSTCICIDASREICIRVRVFVYIYMYTCVHLFVHIYIYT